jgi:hypothetical protein
MNSFINRTTDIVLSNKECFYQFKTTWREDIKVVVTRIIRNGMLKDVETMKDPYSIKKAGERLLISIPHIYLSETCAFFIVHKNIIRKKPVEFYINIRNWLLENDDNGYTLELLWILIFS